MGSLTLKGKSTRKQGRPEQKRGRRKPVAQPQDGADGEVQIAGMIGGEIIPRLLMAHQPAEPAAPRSVTYQYGVTDDEVEWFAQLSLVRETPELVEQIERFWARGVPLDSLCLTLLAPAARKLGQYWESDACDFMDVTLGLHRLQQVLREVSSRPEAPLADMVHAPSALFAPVPGEQHTFGLALVEEFFRRGGWRTERLTETTPDSLVQRVRLGRFDLVGLSVSNEGELEDTSRLIRSLRRAARSGALHVMVGGRIFTEQPHLATMVGADLTAADGLQAVRKARKLLETAASRR